MLLYTYNCSFIFFTDTSTTAIYPLSLHDALPICCTRSPAARWCSRARTSPRCPGASCARCGANCRWCSRIRTRRSEEHTSELQSHVNLVCRLLLEKKNKKKINKHNFNK